MIPLFLIPSSKIYHHFVILVSLSLPLALSLSLSLSLTHTHAHSHTHIITYIWSTLLHSISKKQVKGPPPIHEEGITQETETRGQVSWGLFSESVHHSKQ